MSALALGTMTFGTESDEQTSHAQLDSSSMPGGNLVDTADVYSAGRRRRSSAAGSPASPTRSAAGSCSRRRAAFRWVRARTTRAVAAPPAGGAACDRCGGSGVDHGRPLPAARPRPADPPEETLGFLDDAVRSGEIALRRALELHRLAVAAVRRRGRVPLARSARDAPAPVQPARARDRVGDRARLSRQRARPAAVVSARRRLADRQVHRGTPALGAPGYGEDPERGVEAYDRRAAGAHMGR